MSFDYPWALLLLFAPAAWVVWDWKRQPRLAPLLLKAFMAAAVILALSSPSYTWRDSSVALAVLADTSASLSDADRIRILRDLLRTADAIRKTKSAQELRRHEEVRQSLEQPGRRRYIALCERLG